MLIVGGESADLDAFEERPLANPLAVPGVAEAIAQKHLTSTTHDFSDWPMDVEVAGASTDDLRAYSLSAKYNLPARWVRGCSGSHPTVRIAALWDDLDTDTCGRYHLVAGQSHAYDYEVNETGRAFGTGGGWPGWVHQASAWCMGIEALDGPHSALVEGWIAWWIPPAPILTVPPPRVVLPAEEAWRLPDRLRPPGCISESHDRAWGRRRTRHCDICHPVGLGDNSSFPTGMGRT